MLTLEQDRVKQRAAMPGIAAQQRQRNNIIESTHRWTPRKCRKYHLTMMRTCCIKLYSDVASLVYICVQNDRTQTENLIDTQA